MLRTRVIQALKLHGLNTIGVTSPGPKDGKTLTSINLAISIAREGGYKVVLIDADLRKPSIADDLGISVAKGLIDHLSSDVDFDEILVATDIPNLLVVPGRRVEATLAVPELLSSEKMRQLIDQLHGRDRCIVVVDLPPVRLGDDVVALAPYLDGLLVVVREGVTAIDELKESVELLKDFPILGTVLNQSSVQEAPLRRLLLPRRTGTQVVPNRFAMYESFYNFKRPPFLAVPDPDMLFMTPQHQRALALLEYAFMARAGFCVVTGEVGAGKTTLVRRLLQKVGNQVEVGW